MAEQPIAIRNTWNAVRDHARTYQDFTYVYPVISRRSRGLSIGVNLNPDKVGQVNNLFTMASNYGDYRETWNGVDVNLSLRLGKGALLQGEQPFRLAGYGHAFDGVQVNDAMRLCV